MNKVFLSGRIGKDPEYRKTTSGSSILTFSLATSENYKKDDQWVEKTEWHNVDVWGARADSLSRKARKGMAVIVSGKISTQTWDKQDGSKGYKTVITADKVEVYKTVKIETENYDQRVDDINDQAQFNQQEDDLPF